MRKTREATDSFNYYRSKDGSEMDRHLIKIKNLVMFDVGEQHERTVDKLIHEFAEVGGLIEIFYIAAFAAYLFLG